MPSDQHLTQEQQRKIEDWLKEKGAVSPCPACGNSTFHTAPVLVNIPLYVYGGGMLMGGGAPVVLLACTKCACIRMHSAITMGLAPADSEDGEEAKRGD
jgi:hypothetical protein